MTAGKWELRFHEDVTDEIQKLDTSLRESTTEALKRLIEAPVKRTKKLNGSLRGARTFRFGTPSGEYRALIRLNRDQKIVKVYYIGPREGFYETIRRIFQ